MTRIRRIYTDFLSAQVRLIRVIRGPFKDATEI